MWNVFLEQNRRWRRRTGRCRATAPSSSAAPSCTATRRPISTPFPSCATPVPSSFSTHIVTGFHRVLPSFFFVMITLVLDHDHSNGVRRTGFSYSSIAIGFDLICFFFNQQFAMTWIDSLSGWIDSLWIGFLPGSEIRFDWPSPLRK